MSTSRLIFKRVISRCRWRLVRTVAWRAIPAPWRRAPAMAGLCALAAGGLCSCGASAESVAVMHQRVILVPQLAAGSAGWSVCVRQAEFGCDAIFALTGRRPILATQWTRGNSPPETKGIALVEHGVTAVAIDRLHGFSLHPVHVRREPLPGVGTIRTRPEAGLPDGIRVAEVRLHGPQFSAKALSPRRITATNVLTAPMFFPLSAQGKTIPWQSGEASSTNVGQRYLPVRRLGGGADPSSAPCRIHLGHVEDIMPFATQVMMSVRPQSHLIGAAFISCVQTEYKLGGWTLAASVLVDAAHPGSRPADLAGMRPLAGHLGIFEAPRLDQAILARRVPHGWLVVSAGHTVAQRLSVLEHVHAYVDL